MPVSRPAAAVLLSWLRQVEQDAPATMAGVYEYPRIFTFTSDGSKGDKSMKELVSRPEITRV